MQVIGALQRSYGVESFGAAALLGRRQELLPARSADQGGVRRGRLGLDQYRARCAGRLSLRAAAFSLIALATAGVLGAWWVSYSRNAALIADTDRGVDSYAAAAGAAAQAEYDQRPRPAAGL